MTLTFNYDSFPFTFRCNFPHICKFFVKFGDTSLTQLFKDSHIWDPQCQGLLEQFEEMKECCEIFSLTFTPEVRRFCAMYCLSDESDDCCFLQCYFNQSGIYNGFGHRSDSVEIAMTNNKTASEVEQKIFYRNKNECIQDRYAREYICEIPNSLLEWLQCISMRNYLECPKVQTDEKCKALGSVFNPCQALPTTISPLE